MPPVPPPVPPHVPGPPLAQPATEQQISALVRRFYDLALADPLLGPLFRERIPDLESHLRIVEDFWSHSLLGTGRYRGSPYAAHIGLVLTEEHFTRWLAAFTRAAEATLPTTAAELVLRRARHMSDSFRMGLLPLPPTNRPPVTNP